MSAKWPTSIAGDADLYIAVNSLQTTLSGSINSIVTTITLASTTGFPTAGAVTIDSEVLFYTGVSGATLTGITRGSDGTTAASHNSGVPVGATIVAFHHNGLMAEIEAIETSLNFTASRAMTSNSSGRLTVSATTDTELGYVSGVTSAIQTQINTKATDSSVVHLSGAELITGAKTFQRTKLLLQDTGSNVITIDVATLGSGRTYTLPDAGGSASFVLTESTQTINGAKTLTSGLTITPTTNQLILGTTRTVTITAPTPATTSRTVTMPDLGQDYSLVGTSGTQTISGVKTFDGQLIGKGTATNDSAATGYIGETVAANVSTTTNFPATGTFGDLTSISLTAGDWLLSGVLRHALNGSAAVDGFVGISTTSGNSGTGLVNGDNSLDFLPGTANADSSCSIPGWELKLTGTTTVYLKYSSTYASGQPKATGRISAVRIR